MPRHSPEEMADKARTLALATASDEIGDRPLYVLHALQLPAAARSCAAAGWTSPTADLDLREVIGDRWQGRGRAVVISGDDMFETGLIVVHELAHVVERLRLPEVNTSPGLMFTVRLTEIPDPERGRRCHSLRWHRAMAHLLHRVPRNREYERVRECPIVSDDFGFGSWPTIRRMFAAECESRRWERIDDILESDPPPEAVRLFCG